MRTISFINNKGGVGKTASVIHLAYALSNVYKKRVLIIDLDPQRNSSNFYLKTGFVETYISVHNHGDTAMGMSVENLIRDPDADIHDAITRTEYSNLDIIPCYPTLIALEKDLRIEKNTQQYKLKAHLRKLNQEYDYCLIDCSPSLSLLNINALVASDEAFIPTLADDASLFGIEMTKTELIDEVRHFSPGLVLGGIFFTRYRSYLNLSKFARDILSAVYGKSLLPICISESIKVAESTYRHIPLPLYGKKCKAAQDYITLAGYIAAPNRKKYLNELEKRD